MNTEVISSHGVFSFYSMSWILAYVMLGAVLYILDRSYWHRTYRRLYNIGHKVPLANPQGFIFGHRMRYKVVVAGIISTLETLAFLFLTTFNENPLTEIVLWFIDMPAMVVGFGLGFWLYPFWEKRGTVYTALDTIDEKLQASAAKKEEEVANKAVPPPVIPAPTTPVPVEPEISPMERIRQYANKR